MTNYIGGVNNTGSSGQRVGTFAVGTMKGSIMLPLYVNNIYNQYDSLAIHKAIERLPEENNLAFRERIINSKNHNSSKQGLLNTITNFLSLPDIILTDKTLFNLVNIPLSYFDFIKLDIKDIEYESPIIEVDGVQFDFIQKYSENFEKYHFEGFKDNEEVIYDDTYQYTSCTKNGRTVTIWKNDTKLTSLVQIEPAPTQYVKAIYWQYENDEIIKKIERLYEETEL